MEALKVVWYNLASSYNENDALIDGLWKEIEREYTQAFRYYHNLHHLENMFNLCRQYKDHLDCQSAVHFSIFYHDLIYNPKAHDNEEKSAEIATDRMRQLCVPQEIIKLSRQQILATRSHQLNQNSDTNYFLDFDLAILGADPEVYHEYCRQLRLEFSHYPDALYSIGRKMFLKRMLKMNQIFRTATFNRKYEKQARKNLKSELKGL